MSQLVEYFFNVQDQDQSFLSMESITETAIDSWKLNIEWLKSCVSDLSSSIHGFDDLSDAEKGKHIIERLLFSDLNLSCAAGGVLPKNVDTLHDVNLPGPFVLQVNEIVDVCIPPKDRFLDLPYGLRCLKLSMTDGVQCVTCMEQRPIEDLQVASPAGLKVLIHNVNVRHGCLMLVPEGLKVLGGMEDLSVEEIDDATPVWRCKKQKKTFQEPKEKEVSNVEADYEEAIRGLVSSMIYGKADDEFKESNLESLIHSL
ncbi:hypothetical protein MKX03_023026 [Papaver bracteatum]|nr:hypothetical protein MKX03_023026 [Papaver bracteatum]